jgi:hypothetical protein
VVPAVIAPNPTLGYSGGYGYAPPAVSTYAYEPGYDYSPALDSLYFGWGGDMLYPGYSGWGYFGFCNDGHHHRDHDGNHDGHGARLHQGTAFGGSSRGAALGASAHQGAIGRATAPPPAVGTTGPVFHSQGFSAGSFSRHEPFFSARFTPAPAYRSSIPAPRFAPSPSESSRFSARPSGGGFSPWGSSGRGGGAVSRGGYSHGGGGGGRR